MQDSESRSISDSVTMALSSINSRHDTSIKSDNEYSCVLHSVSHDLV